MALVADVWSCILLQLQALVRAQHNDLVEYHCQMNHRIIELLRLEKTLKIIKSNHNLTITYIT